MFVICQILWNFPLQLWQHSIKDFGKLYCYELKESPVCYCEFWTNSYCLVSSAKNSVCKLSLLLLPWQQTMPQSEKKGIQSKFSTRQVFPSTLFCTFFFPFPPSTMSSTRWTGKNKEQSFAQTLCFFNCYCFMPQYVVSYFRWDFYSMQVLTSAVDWHSYTQNVLYYFLCF